MLRRMGVFPHGTSGDLRENSFALLRPVRSRELYSTWDVARENALYLASLDHKAWGVDSSSLAIDTRGSF